MALLLLTGGAGVALAKGGRNETKVLAKDQVINRDYFTAGGQVELSGTVNGDAYVAGGQVLIDGSVNGDLLVTGGSVTVSGKVSGDLRVAGGQVTISGQIGRNLTAGGGSVEIGSNASVGGSGVVGGGSVTLSGPINGNLKVAGGSVTLADKIGGDVDANSGQLRLTSKAAVGGNLSYWSQKDASIDPAAKVTGRTQKHAPAQRQPDQGFRFLKALFGLLSTLVVGLILLKLFPRYSLAVVETLKRRPWQALGIGFGVLILFPIVCVIALVTIIGIPLGLIGLAAYLASLYIAPIFVMLFVGQFAIDKANQKVGLLLAFMFGAVIYWVVTLLPIAGGIVAFVSILLGLGASAMTKFQLHKNLTKT